MRVLFFTLVFLLASCTMDSKDFNHQSNTIYKTDTVYIEKLLTDTLYINTGNCDSLNHLVTELNDKLFVSNYKIERVRYYLNITIKNPSQNKFLKGWVKRAIE